MSDGVRVVAASEGIDPASLPPKLLLDSIRLRCAVRNEERRQDAQLQWNALRVHCGVKMDWWEFSSSLYPKGFIDGVRERQAEAEQTNAQMELLRRMEAMR